MAITELRELQEHVEELARSFRDRATLQAIETWSMPFSELALPSAAWLVFDTGDGRGVAYTIEEVWKNTPWGIVRDLNSIPKDESWGESLEESCQILVHGAVVDNSIESKLRRNIEKQRRRKEKRKNA